MISVPANSSRLFSSVEEAKSQPIALLRLDSFVSPTNVGYLFNKEFDASEVTSLFKISLELLWGIMHRYLFSFPYIRKLRKVVK